METAVQGLIHAEVERALNVSRSLGGEYQMKIELGPPPVVNDAGMVALVKEAAAGLLGSDKVLDPEPMMGGEDFAFMSALVPAAWFRLGCRIEGDTRFPHSSSFDVDERCLPIGVAMLVEAALRFLRCSKG
jgi:amidohydrolase